MASPAHPLTGRVIVNRVWQWHFGEGIVRSPDNFGTLGEKPTHPALLDWLASVFTAPDSAGQAPGTEGLGWSLKRLHRMILLSSVYRQSSSTAHSPQSPGARARAMDPENRLLWRFNRRRLEAEAIRDSLLAVSGSLDLTMGGTLLPLKNREYVTSTANRDTTDYNSPRRAVYLPVVRSSLYDFFTAFDFGDPSVLQGRRDSTTVAPQALFMMNGGLMLRESRRMAERLLADAALNDAGRIRGAFMRAYGRAPRPEESARLLEFVRRVEASLADRVADAAERRLRAWQSACRVVLAASEFIYVD